MKRKVHEKEKEMIVTKLTINEFMQGSMNITDEMFNAYQPFAGFISKGVYERYIKPLEAKKRYGAIAGRLHDIAFMSAPFRDWGSSPTEVRKHVETDVIRGYGLSIGGRKVRLHKLYNVRDFEEGWIACLIMLPEEAERFIIDIPDEQDELLNQECG